MKKIAILGASGQIGRGLALEFMGSHELLLFARDVELVQSFISVQGPNGRDVEVLRLEEFGNSPYDVVISAIGPGDPGRIRGMGADIFGVTERFDSLILNYLERNPDTIYVFLSTGAIYGNSYSESATEQSRFAIPINDIGRDHFYPLAKLVAEAKHRALAHLCIIDVRIFGFFSRHIDTGGDFFLSELADCVVGGKTFHTNNVNFVRDYVSSDDLASFINLLLKGRGRNGAYDIYSASPVTKFELLEELGRTFGLSCEIADSKNDTARAVQKPSRISNYGAAEKIGYIPRRTSMDIVIRELKAMVKDRRNAEASIV